MIDLQFIEQSGRSSFDEAGAEVRSRALSIKGRPDHPVRRHVSAQAAAERHVVIVLGVDVQIDTAFEGLQWADVPSVPATAAIALKVPANSQARRWLSMSPLDMLVLSCPP